MDYFDELLDKMMVFVLILGAIHIAIRLITGG